MYDVKVLHLLDKSDRISWKSFSNELKIFIVLMIFLDSATGTLLLDGVCMKLIATGEV